MKWGRANYRDFPWRSESDPWLALVAEVLLQRTRARQATEAYCEFRDRFPTPAAFAAASEEEVRQVTSSLGLHWRAPLLKEAASIIAENGGKPPEDSGELTALPGIGPYAAAAWLSLHRGKRAVIVDNNVARWLCRMMGRPYDAETRRKRWLRELADELTPARVFRDYNYAVLDFTMHMCRPAKPRCHECPLLELCEFGSSNQVGSL